ncbi:MAG: peptidoglycan DD-metalloendopeptidase family protein [Acidobacteriota bacterium]
MRIALLIVALAAVPVLAQDPPTGATPTTDEERLRIVQDRRAALEAELHRLRGEEKSLLGEVEQLEVELRLRTAELREIRLNLRRTQAELDATVESVQQLEGRLAAARPLLAAHARALYKLGELSYVRLLLSVDSPSDFFRGYRFVTTLARRDRERVAAFRSDLADLKEQKAVLEKRTAESITLRERLVAARRRLDSQRRRKTELLTSIVEQKETHAAYVKELAEAERRLEQLLNGLGEGAVAIPVAAFKGSLPWPVRGPVRAGFGRRKHPRFDTYTVHNGIEIASPPGTEVKAIHEGTVVFAERFRGYGLMVVIDHGGRHHSLYAQLSELTTSVGQKVATGDVVGLSGQGGLESPGVYFEMRHGGRPEDPLDWLQRP